MVIITQDGTSSLLLLKNSVILSQCCGAVGILKNMSSVNRSRVHDIISLNNRNNTNLACSLIFGYNMFLFLSLFNVIFFLQDNTNEKSTQLLVPLLVSQLLH